MNSASLCKLSITIFRTLPASASAEKKQHRPPLPHFSQRPCLLASILPHDSVPLGLSYSPLKNLAFLLERDKTPLRTCWLLSRDMRFSAAQKAKGGMCAGDEQVSICMAKS